MVRSWECMQATLVKFIGGNLKKKKECQHLIRRKIVHVYFCKFEFSALKSLGVCLEWEIQGENKNWRNNILRKQYTTHNHSKNTKYQKVHFGVYHIR